MVKIRPPKYVNATDALADKLSDPQAPKLQQLRKEFEAMVARMQAPKSRKAMDFLLSASAGELNAVSANSILNSLPKRRGRITNVALR